MLDVVAPEIANNPRVPTLFVKYNPEPSVSIEPASGANINAAPEVVSLIGAVLALVVPTAT